MNNGTVENTPTFIFQIVQEKFLPGETVKAVRLGICEFGRHHFHTMHFQVLHAYQRIGVETSNRILALVATQDSYAVFSFALACDKPRTFSDLVVDNIFPIDKGFRMESEVRNTISVLGFSLSSSQSARKSTFYPSHPDDADEYTSFKLLVDDIFDYKVRTADTYPQAIVPPPFDDDESGTGGGTTTDESGFFGSEKEFSWLARYRREDDLLAIDRCIADGSKPLLKGESKFQYELKKHEHEYIINKTYRSVLMVFAVSF